MAMKNPPRRTTIKGQKHLLAYITPEEAQLLMDNGGSGEPGPMGIPAFYEKDRPGAGGKGEMGDKGGFGGDFGGGSKDNDVGKVDPGLTKAAAKAAAEDAEIDKAIAKEIADRAKYQNKKGYGLSGALASAMFGDATMSGMGFNSSDIERILGSASVDVTGVLPELQRRARKASQFSTLGKIFSPGMSIAKSIFGIPSGATSYDNLATLIGIPGSTIMSGGLLGPDAVLGVPTGGTGAFGTPAHLSQGYFGTIGYTGMPNPDYTGPFENLVGGYKGVDRGGDGIVPTQTNPVTGEQQCPDGYMFDEDLQACRLSVGLPGGDDASGFGELGAATGDLFGRMGLLDIAPTGLGMFKQRFGAGFGSPSEFDTANMAFKQSAGVQRPYPGYTLLS